METLARFFVLKRFRPLLEAVRGEEAEHSERCSNGQLYTLELLQPALAKSHFFIFSTFCSPSEPLCAHSSGSFPKTLALPCFSLISTGWQPEVDESRVQVPKSGKPDLVRTATSTRCRSKVKVTASLGQLATCRKALSTPNQTSPQCLSRRVSKQGLWSAVRPLYTLAWPH